MEEGKFILQVPSQPKLLSCRGWVLHEGPGNSAERGTKAPAHGIFPQPLSLFLPSAHHCPSCPAVLPSLLSHKTTELQGKSSCNPSPQAPEGSPCSPEHFMPSWRWELRRAPVEPDQPSGSPCSVTGAVNDQQLMALLSFSAKAKHNSVSQLLSSATHTDTNTLRLCLIFAKAASPSAPLTRNLLSSSSDIHNSPHFDI